MSDKFFGTICPALTVAMVAAFSILGSAQAAETLKFAHVYEISEPFHRCALWAADEIKRRTNGRYEVEVFPASALGKEVDINDGLSLGIVDMIYTGAAFAGRSYGPIAISSAPYMFRDVDHWKAYAESGLFEELSEGYRMATGNKVAAMTYYGERHVTSNKSINTPDDMRGLRIRVPKAPLYMMFPEAVGAQPTPFAFDVVYLALRQGVVDAQENPLPTIRAKKFYEVQSNISLTGHITDSLLTIIGGPLWNRLTDEDKTVFVDVFRAAAASCTEEVVQIEHQLEDWFKAQGIKVNVVDRTPFREAVITRHKRSDANWPKDVYDRLQALK